VPQSCPEARGFGSRLIVLRVRARDSKDVYRGELPTALAARTREDVALKYGHVFAVSLVFLVFEIRQNTLTQEREMQLDRYLGLTDPYLNAPEIGAIYAKVKAVDGMEPLAGAYVDRYKLTPAEAVVWSRLVSRSLLTLHAQFQFGGPSEEFDTILRGLFVYPDFRMAFEINEDSLLSSEFVQYADSIIDEP